jgi:hypothetical protein
MTFKMKVRPCWKCSASVMFAPTDKAPLGAWINVSDKTHHRCPVTNIEYLAKKKTAPRVSLPARRKHTIATDYSLPICDCKNPPWEDCMHTTVDDSYLSHLKSI